jgi:hypothetical protein
VINAADALAYGSHARALGRDHRAALGRLDGLSAVEAVVKDPSSTRTLRAAC